MTLRTEVGSHNFREKSLRRRQLWFGAVKSEDISMPEKGSIQSVWGWGVGGGVCLFCGKETNAIIIGIRYGRNEGECHTHDNNNLNCPVCLGSISCLEISSFWFTWIWDCGIGILVKTGEACVLHCSALHCTAVQCSAFIAGSIALPLENLNHLQSLWNVHIS